MKNKKDYYVLQGEKVGVHTLLEHLNIHSGAGEYPMAKFKCGACGVNYITTIKSARIKKTCGCAKFKYKINLEDIIDILKKDPFIKIKTLADMVGISYGIAQIKRNQAFKKL